MEPVRRYRCGWSYGGPSRVTAVLPRETEMADPADRFYRLTTIPRSAAP